MATVKEEYNEQVQVLESEYLQESKEKRPYLSPHLHNDPDQVLGSIGHAAYRNDNLDRLENQFALAVAALLQSNAFARTLKRSRLLRLIERFNGVVTDVEEYLQKLQERQNQSHLSRDEQREMFRKQYASQLAAVGLNVHSPCVLDQLEKHHGDVNKVIEIMQRRREKKENTQLLQSKYASQLAQLASKGIELRNIPTLLHLLERSNGQVDAVESLLAEEKSTRDQTSSHSMMPSSKKQDELHNEDDELSHLKQLRAAGVHGNPTKILAVFHQCHQSIELTRVRLAAQRAQRDQQQENRLEKRIVFSEIHDAYLTIRRPADWPDHIEQVYFDGNNMMFVIDVLRRLCLNREGRRTEQAIAEIAAAWNEQMRVRDVQLIFDSTEQTGPMGSVQVKSAQPTNATTDDMLIDLVRHKWTKNAHTVVLTADRALAIQLKHEGCLLIKPYNWFAHCVMILAPDLIKHGELDDATGVDFSQPSQIKLRYDFDQLVHRITKIEM